MAGGTSGENPERGRRPSHSLLIFIGYTLIKGCISRLILKLGKGVKGGVERGIVVRWSVVGVIK